MDRGYLANQTAHGKLRRHIPFNVREYVLKRDRFRCVGPDCKSGPVPIEDLELHHLDHDPANNQLGNVVTSCHTCNMIANGEHVKAMRRMRALYKGLTNYKINQATFEFET